MTKHTDNTREPSAQSFRILNGDVASVLRELPSDYFDAVLSDPPYGLTQDGGKTGFMGKNGTLAYPAPKHTPPFFAY